MDAFKTNGILDLSIIRGYKKEKISFPNVTYFENSDFMTNNILHSLMNARPKIEQAISSKEDIIVSYSDIWYEPAVVRQLIQSKELISAVVDTDWEEYYEGRTDHPIEEAENVIFDDSQHILKIGKHIITEKKLKENQGEFIGLWKFTPEGAQIFLDTFDQLNNKLGMTDPYQNTKEWQKSYITDIFQELTDRNVKIHVTVIQKGWKEFDTVQDFKKAGGELPDQTE